MAGSSTLPQFRLIQARMRMAAFAVAAYFLEIGAFQQRRTADFLLGFGMLLAVRRVTAALALAVGAALGGQFLWLDIGLGPRLSRSVIGNQVRVVRLLPIVVGGMFMPKEQSFARTQRIFIGAVFLLPIVLAALLAPVLPAYAGLTLVVLTAVLLVLTATTRDAASGRTVVARVFVKPTELNDPYIADPHLVLAGRSACIDVQFGDLGPAQAALGQLRAEPGGEFGAAVLATELLAARGDYDAALRVAFPELPPAAAQAAAEARHATDSARAAKLLMLVAEKDPSLAAKAVPLAQRHIAAMARNGLAAQADRTGRALFALQAGDLPSAQRESRICLARARTPLALADALCTQARIDAQRGHGEKAAKRLDEAEKFAPWYPRVATVRQLVSADAATALPQPVIGSARTDTAHVFAEPWSVAPPAPDEG